MKLGTILNIKKYGDDESSSLAKESIEMADGIMYVKDTLESLIIIGTFQSELLELSTDAEDVEQTH